MSTLANKQSNSKERITGFFVNKIAKIVISTNASKDSIIRKIIGMI